MKLFKTFLKQFVNWRDFSTDSGENETCEGCRISIGQVSTLHQEIEAIQSKIKEIVTNCVQKINLDNSNSNPESSVTANNNEVIPHDRLEQDAITTCTPVQINSPQEEENNLLQLDEVEIKMEEMDYSIVVLPPPQDGASVCPSGEEISHGQETSNDQNEETLDISESDGRSNNNTHFVCRKCGNLFSNMKNYALHEVLVCKVSWPTYTMHNLGIYLRSCNFTGCDEHFLDTAQLERHMLSHVEDALPLPSPAEELYSQKTSNIQNVKELTTTQDNFQYCIKCGRSVPTALIQWHEGKFH